MGGRLTVSAFGNHAML